MTDTSTATSTDQLAALLPQHLRAVDAEAGGALAALLAVIGEQAAAVGADIGQRYLDWFIETCVDEIVPLLGDLVGYRTLGGYTEALAAGGDQARRLAASLAPRADVAATVATRRRKGTLALLEELSLAVARWPARAVEFRRLLAPTFPVRRATVQDHGEIGTASSPVIISSPVIMHGCTGGAGRAVGRYVDLRNGAELDALGSPFETTSRLAEAARITADLRGRRQGRYNPPAVGLFVWRRAAYSLTHAPAFCIDRARNLFTFSILGNDTPLVTKPLPEPSPNHLAGPENVPVHLGRRWTRDQLLDVYGPDRSFAIWRDGASEQIPPSAIVIADLSDWHYRPRRDQVAVDPERGRIAFGGRHAPRGGVWVTYHYAAAADLGGGEYPRSRITRRGDARYRVGAGQEFHRIMDAYQQWRNDRAGGGPERAIIEITDGGAYQEQVDLAVGPGERLELRAAEGTRPVLRLLDWYSNRPDALQIRDTGDTCGPDQKPPVVVLDGLLITGRGISVTGAVGSVLVRHCTLVPGWSLEPHCEPTHPEEPSLLLEGTSACLQIEHSILGTILVIGDEVHTDPLDIHLSDSVLDATDRGREALSGPDCGYAHAVLHVRRSTVIGELHVHAVALGENSVFDGRIRVARRAIGCLRWSYVGAGSRTPRRYHCVPESAGSSTSSISPLRPQFVSTRYGTVGYAELARVNPPELLRGAEDGSELGVFHDLFGPQREDNLRARLLEFSPAGTDTGLIFAT